MDPSASSDPDSSLTQGATAGCAESLSSEVGDPSMSLAFALRAIVRCGGVEADLDDIVAALGLPFTTCAVPGEEDLTRWPLHARDAFLVEAGKLFGICLRAIHPPDAAQGLDRAPEFSQHFHASYRPLILRALEHSQPVLAWRGWPGRRAGLWGITSQACDGGVGFRGFTMTPAGDSPSDAPLLLESPPLQLYVAETVSAVCPNPGELVDVMLEHARRALANELTDIFAVVTGPGAYDAWIARLINAGGGSLAAPDPAEGHSRMATAVIAGRQSAMRFFQRHGHAVPGDLRSLVESLSESCQDTVTALSGSTVPSVCAELLKTGVGRRALAEQVAAARAAATKALLALQSRAKANQKK